MQNNIEMGSSTIFCLTTALVNVTISFRISALGIAFNDGDKIAMFSLSVLDSAFDS